MSVDSDSRDSPERLLRQASAALDRALRAGTPARAEEWLSACPALAADPDLALELIYGEYVSREALGPTPDPQEYYRRFPDWSDRLHRLFQVDDLLRGEPTQAKTLAGDASTSPSAPAAPPPTERQIGSCEIIERIGGGGMGVVYKARQRKPARIVALKLLRSGADAGATELARFRREADAVARLQHPNIVALYELGEHEQQPYLVLEYVPDGDLRGHLAGRPQPTDAMAALVATTARAAHYAHTQGVVHRDLKPGNILLQRGDSLVPKIADFGLAALADSGQGLTRSGQALGTSTYMAPEQAIGKKGAVAPAVDIYSLGSILYEGLTGRPPFPAETDAEMFRMLLLEEPLPPRRLRPGLPRDIETIVLKCLNKEPRRRYSSADALADDLDRFRAGEPIWARPVSGIEVAWKWAKRRPAVVSLMVVIAAGLIGLAWVTATYTKNLRGAIAVADDARNRAQTNEQKAKQSAIDESKRRVQAREALDKLTARLIADAPTNIRRPAEQLAALEQALKSYEELAADAADDEASRVGVAAAFREAASLQYALGRTADAERTYVRAIDQYARLVRDFPTPANRVEQAVVLHNRGILRMKSDQYAAAEPDFREALATFRKFVDLRSSVRRHLGTALLNLANILHTRNSHAEADELDREAIVLWERLRAEFPKEADYRHGLASALNNQSLLLVRQRKLDEAEEGFRKVLALRLTGNRAPTNPEDRANVARCLHNLAGVHEARKQTAQAAEAYWQAAKIWESLVADQPNVFPHLGHWSGSLTHLSVLLTTSKERSELDLTFLRLRRTLDARGSDRETQLLRGLTACNHGLLMYRMDKPAEALIAYGVAERALRPYAGEVADPQPRLFLANTLSNAGDASMKLERYLDAHKAYSAASSFTTGLRRAHFQIDAAKSLAHAGDKAKAIAALAAVGEKDNPALFYPRASAYAVADDDAQSLAWLDRCRGEKATLDADIVRRLKTSADWTGLRSRPALAEYLK